MNYLVFLKLGGISNACGNDLPNEHPSLLKTVGQLGAITVTIRHQLSRGPRAACQTQTGRLWGSPSSARPFACSAEAFPSPPQTRTTFALRPGPCQQGPPCQVWMSIFCSKFAGEKVEGDGRGLNRIPVSGSDGSHVASTPDTQPLM